MEKQLARRKMRRWLGMLLAGITVSSALSACSAGKAPVTTTQSSESQISGTQASGKEEEQVTLRFLSWAGEYEEIEKKVIDLYHDQNPNVTVNIEYITEKSTDYLTKTDVMLMGGEPIDIIMSPSARDYIIRAESDSYLPLDPFFEAEGLNIEDEYNVVYKVNDQVYGIPAEMKYALVLINKDMLDEAGLPVPPLDWTWEDYREYAIKMTKGEGAEKIYGSYFHTFSDMVLYGISSAKAGNKIFNEDGSLTFENPEFAKFMQFRYDLENKDKASVPLADMKALNMSYADQFFKGKAAMLPMMTYMLNYIGNEKYVHDFETTFARLPLWDKNDPHYTPVGATIFCIAKTTEHPQEAYDFLKFWCTEGVKIKGMTIANQKGVNKFECAESMVGNASEQVDMEALNNVLNDEKWVDSYEEFIPAYQSEIENIMLEESDKYLLGSQSLEEMIANLMKRGNAVIDENK
ncbi:MAG: extracellular solute-binding protein [Clostridiaceae bacterium]|nr:extracellular solute-binding protein [Clostridiaceae bacterium]